MEKELVLPQASRLCSFTRSMTPQFQTETPCNQEVPGKESHHHKVPSPGMCTSYWIQKILSCPKTFFVGNSHKNSMIVVLMSPAICSSSLSFLTDKWQSQELFLGPQKLGKSSSGFLPTMETFFLQGSADTLVPIKGDHDWENSHFLKQHQ